MLTTLCYNFRLLGMCINSFHTGDKYNIWETLSWCAALPALISKTRSSIISHNFSSSFPETYLCPHLVFPYIFPLVLTGELQFYLGQFSPPVYLTPPSPIFSVAFSNWSPLTYSEFPLSLFFYTHCNDKHIQVLS